MTAALPAGLLYGTVRWTVVGIEEDDLDVDAEPQADLINGKVTFTPIFERVKFLGTVGDPEPRTILPRPQTYLVVNGRLVDKEGRTDISLVACDSPSTTPQGWQYKVDYILDDGYTFGSFLFSLEGGDVVDLTLQTPEVAVDGVPVIVGPQGPQGPAGTITVGTVTTGDPGTPVEVENVGTSTAAILDFTIPRGEDGAGGGASDHGALTGLADDDHTQYHTDARGDARYVGLSDTRLTDSRTPTAHTHPVIDLSDSTAVGRSVLVAATAAAARTAIGAGTSSLALGSTGTTAAAGDHLHDDRYYTESEADTQITAAKARANHTGTQSLDTTTDSATRLAMTAAERTKLSGVATGATANSSDATLLARANHTGTQSLDTTTDSATRLAMTSAERTKLTGVATGATANATDAQLRDRATHTGTQVAATLSDLTEVVQDIVGSLVVAGVNTTVSYDDTAGTFTINSTAGGGGTDPEIVRDVIGTALVAGSGVQITLNDVGDTITIASTAVLPTRQVISGTGLTGGGDLSADRTLAVAYGTTAGTAAQGNDGRLSDARTPLTHTHTASQISDSTTTGRAVVVAATQADARTAIGAGTSSLVLGTTGTTAKAGDYAPPASSETVPGVVELATAAETTTGTDSTRAVHPAGVKAVADLKVSTSTVTGSGMTLDSVNGRIGLAGNTAPSVPVDIGTGANSPGITTKGTLQLFRGSQATPVTTIDPGNQIRLVKFENLSAATMANNPANNDVTAPLAIYNRGAATSYAQVSCAWLVAQGGGPALGNDVGPLQAIAIGSTDGPYAAIGGYFEARKAFSQTLITGTEITAQNDSGVDDTSSASVTALDKSTGIWLISRGASRIASAIQIGRESGSGGFDNGVIVSSNAAIRNSFVDWSSAATSIAINGTHATAALAIAPGAGNVGIGILSPTAFIDLVQSSVQTAIRVKSNAGATASTPALELRSSADAVLSQITAFGHFRVAATATDFPAFSHTTDTNTGFGLTGADGMYVSTNAVVRQRWDNAGVQFGPTLALGGGVGVVGVTDATTVPSTNPSGGGVLYSEGGLLKWRTSAGVVHVIGTPTATGTKDATTFLRGDGTWAVPSGGSSVDATETVKGIVELATTAEVTTGTDTVRAVTPAGVKVVADTKVPTTRTVSTTAPLTGGGDLSADRTLAVSAASETAAGVVELATAAETTTGTDSTRAVHPAGLKVELDKKAAKVLTSTTQTGTTYTLALGDAETQVLMNNAAAQTVTVPPNSSVAFPVGTTIAVRAYGAGQVTIAPGAGVTLRSRGGALKTAGQYAGLSLTKQATDEWFVDGDATT